MPCSLHASLAALSCLP